MATTMGPIGMVFKGAYDAAVEYQLLNVVTDGGNSYVYRALTAGTGKPLPVAPAVTTEYWAAIALKGEAVELRASGDAIQWRVAGGAWTELVSIATMTGAAGESAVAAALSATAAAGSATEAGQQAADAAGSALAAEAAQLVAEAAKSGAEAGQLAAEAAQAEAEAAQAAALAAQEAAETAESGAEGEATAAAQAAAAAAASAAQAASSAEAAGSAHPLVNIQPDTDSTASPEAGGTVDVVGDVTRNSLGHVEKINIKSITLPPAYAHPSHPARASGLYKVTVDAQGHPVCRWRSGNWSAFP